MFLLWTTLFSLLLSCTTTQEHKDITRIPYSMIAKDLEFWNERKESQFVSLDNFIVRVKTEESFELYLTNQNGEKRELVTSKDGPIDSVQLPKMAVEDAQNWTLIIDKPAWKVKITPAVKIKLPTKKVRYKDFFIVLKDYDRRLKESNTWPSWLRQDYYRFYLTFPKPSYVFYENKKGKQTTYGNGRDTTLILKLDEEYYEENGWLVFSNLPDMILALN